MKKIIIVLAIIVLIIILATRSGNNTQEEVMIDNDAIMMDEIMFEGLDFVIEVDDSTMPQQEVFEIETEVETMPAN